MNAHYIHVINAVSNLLPEVPDQNVPLIHLMNSIQQIVVFTSPHLVPDGKFFWPCVM